MPIASRARAGQRLGAGDDALLLLAGVALRGVELGEVGASLGVDRAASVAEPLPEVVRLALRQARARRWASCQRANSASTVWPVAFHCTRRGIAARRGPPISSTIATRSARACSTSALCSSERCAVRSSTVPVSAATRSRSACEVADGGRRLERLAQPVHRLRDVGGRCAASRALLEQRHLARQVLVLALVVGDRLGGGRRRGTRRPARSPSPSRTNTTPCSSTRPHGCVGASATSVADRSRAWSQRSPRCLRVLHRAHPGRRAHLIAMAPSRGGDLRLPSVEPSAVPLLVIATRARTARSSPSRTRCSRGRAARRLVDDEELAALAVRRGASGHRDGACRVDASRPDVDGASARSRAGRTCNRGHRVPSPFGSPHCRT